MGNLGYWFVIPFGSWYITPTIILIAAIALFFQKNRSERIIKTQNCLFIIALICYNIVSLLVINNMIQAVVPFFNSLN